MTDKWGFDTDLAFRMGHLLANPEYRDFVKAAGVMRCKQADEHSRWLPHRCREFTSDVLLACDPKVMTVETVARQMSNYGGRDRMVVVFRDPECKWGVRLMKVELLDGGPADG